MADFCAPLVPPFFISSADLALRPGDVIFNAPTSTYAQVVAYHDVDPSLVVLHEVDRRTGRLIGCGRFIAPVDKCRLTPEVAKRIIW